MHGPECYQMLEPKERLQALLQDNAKEVFKKINCQNDKDFALAEQYFTSHYMSIDWDNDHDLFNKILSYDEELKEQRRVLSLEHLEDPEVVKLVQKL